MKTAAMPRCIAAVFSSGLQPLHHPRERNRFTHMMKPADPVDRALDAHPEAGVRDRPVAPQIEVPLERLQRQIVLLDLALERFVIVLALSAADNLAVAL